MNLKKQYNLQYLKKNRLKSGDIFAMLLNGEYLFGRVIRDNLSFDDSPFSGSSLVYIYDIRAITLEIDFSKLSTDHLLIPPLFISDVLWSKGYAMKLVNINISEYDLLERHCFYSPSKRKYFDETGIQLESRVEPCGEWVYVVGLDYVDNKISDALQIKRAPLTENDMYYMSGKGEKIWFKKPISELKKYSNFDHVIHTYPEVIENQI